MVYQEQVMQIASKLADYTLGEGDVLRRAMGKKDMKEMVKQREKFTQGALKNGIGEDIANRIFDKMEKFAEYGFNKSHAAAYGYLTYVTAYLKAHYPGEWLASLMTCDKDDIEKIAKYIHEGQESGIRTLPPHINESLLLFTATSEGIRFALAAIKGVGTNVVEAIIEERMKRGPFSHLHDFISRIDMKRIGKKSIELLVDSGAFDFTTWSRDELKASIDPMYEEAQRLHKEKSTGVLSLFAQEERERPRFMQPPKLAKTSYRLPDELLFREKELLGLFLTGHPLDSFQELIQRLGNTPLSKVTELDFNSVFRCACMIETAQVRFSSKTGKKFAILTISDGTIGSDGKSQYELPVWSDQYEANASLLVENKLIWTVLTKEKRDQGTQLSCRWLGDLKTIDEKVMQQADIAYDRAKQSTRMRASFTPNPNRPPKPQKAETATAVKKNAIVLDLEKLRLSHILEIKSIIQSTRGESPLEVRFVNQAGEIAVLHLSGEFFIAQDHELQDRLAHLPSVVAID